ncbi:ATP-binding protein [Bombella sp. TMW 2.2559]|uniref:ATP-binding protein n=1 Tax=Bombella dulcis TaxID=2967339 RepID=A0ABT3WGL6_9PROT|nr:AAA family ATPase [Bombella dulcis]MCX5616016.1 ATP-binding protein [Bombella dulcis]
MSFTIKPAVREKIGLLFGIAGASGSGKTFSALTLAEGIKGKDGKIAVIDTEAGRALHYAPHPGQKADPSKGTFDFLHVDFQPPFEPMRYIEAIRAAEKAGATVIVIDSMSHEWDGEGGCSDMAEEAAMSAATDRNGNFQQWKFEAMTAPSWKKPKQQHKRMMARLIQTRTHLIFCLRAQEKIKFEKVINPKTGRERNEIRQMGFQPICEKSFMFELSGSMTMHPETPGQPRYDLPHKLNHELRDIFPSGKCIVAEQGSRLKNWAENGTDRPPEDRSMVEAREMVEAIQDAATVDALQKLTSDQGFMGLREKLRASRPRLSERVDKAVRDKMASFEANEDELGGTEASTHSGTDDLEVPSWV